MTSPDDVLDSRWRRPGPTRADLRFDALLALVMLGLSALSMALYSAAQFYDDPAEWWVSILIVLAFTLPLAVRRRWPEAVAVVVSAAFAASQLLRVPEMLIVQIATFVALYTLGAWGRSRSRSIAVRAAIIFAMFAWVFLELLRVAANPSALPGYDPDRPLSAIVAAGLISVLINLLYFGSAYWFGDRGWFSARERVELDRRTAELAAERERTAEQAVSLERIRIARELHDVVAHHVSVMGVQAGAARRVLTRDPEKAEQALSAVESNAREAVDELHRMLTTLRDATSERDEAVSSPSTRGLDQIEALVAEIEAAGRAVSFEQIGEARPVSPAVDMTLHRVAQEALTNVIKHAPAEAPVDVRLRYLRDAVEVEVTNGGGPRPARAVGAGLGQVGMRERISAVGGTLELGPRRLGGYLVRAAVPTSPSGAGS